MYGHATGGNHPSTIPTPTTRLPTSSTASTATGGVRGLLVRIGLGLRFVKASNAARVTEEQRASGGVEPSTMRPNLHKKNRLESPSRGITTRVDGNGVSA